MTKRGIELPPLYKSIPVRLKQVSDALIERGIVRNMAEIAKDMKISTPTLSKYCSPSSSGLTSLPIVFLFAEKYNVSSDYVVHGKGSMFRDVGDTEHFIYFYMSEDTKSMFHQYFVGFNDFYRVTKGITQKLQIKDIDDGLQIQMPIENSQNIVSVFLEYLYFIIHPNLADIHPNFTVPINREEKERCIRKIRKQVNRIQEDFREAKKLPDSDDISLLLLESAEAIDLSHEKIKELEKSLVLETDPNKRFKIKNEIFKIRSWLKN